MSLRPTIKGIGAWVPEYILDNAKLEKMVDTSDQWIRDRTGIHERRILQGEGKGASVLGIEAVRNLCETTALNPQDIDAILCATVVPDYKYPPTACLIAEGTGASNAFCFDLNATCSGYLYALEVAAGFLSLGKYRNIVIVTAEKLSSMTDYTDRASCILFGDAGTATWVGMEDTENGIVDILLKSDSSGAMNIVFRGGGSAYPASHETVDKKWHYFWQDGRSVFKHAVKGMSSVCQEVLSRNSLSVDDIDFLIPHQANKRIIDTVGSLMGVSEDKVLVNIQHYGNTSSSSIPLCIWDSRGKIRTGDSLMLTAFGSGYTYGAVYLKWS